VEETVVKPGGPPPGTPAAEHGPKGILRIGILPDKKIKKICHPASTIKKLFPDFPANADYHQPQLQRRQVSHHLASPDAKAAPAGLPPPEEIMNARMLNRLSVAPATVSLSLSW